MKSFGSSFAIAMAVMLPFGLTKIFMSYISNIVSIMWTNVQGLKKRLVITGAKQSGIIVFVPGSFQIPNGVSFLTVDDLIGMAVISDKQGGMQHLDDFIEIYNE